MHQGSPPAIDQTLDPIERERSTYMTDPQAEQLCQVFADGLDSGIGYARILSLLERHGLSDKIVDPLREAVLERGDLLGEAFTRYGLLDPTARKLIIVAEQQGKLPVTFKQLSTIYSKRHARKKNFAFAMVEPIVLTALGLIVFANLMGGNLVDLAFSSDTNSKMVDIFVKSALECGIYGMAWFTVFFTWLNLPVDLSVRDLFTRLWMKVPVLSDPRRLFGISLFCRYLKQSITSGLDVYRSLELAGEAANHPKLNRQLEGAREDLQEGASLGQALFEVEVLPDDVVENIEIGETSGRLDERLEFLAERYDEKATERFERQMKAALWIIRYAIVAFVVGSVFVQVLQMGI